MAAGPGERAGEWGARGGVERAWRARGAASQVGPGRADVRGRRGAGLPGDELGRGDREVTIGGCKGARGHMHDCTITHPNHTRTITHKIIRAQTCTISCAQCTMCAQTCTISHTSHTRSHAITHTRDSRARSSEFWVPGRGYWDPAADPEDRPARPAGFGSEARTWRPGGRRPRARTPGSRTHRPRARFSRGGSGARENTLPPLTLPHSPPRPGTWVAGVPGAPSPRLAPGLAGWLAG